MASDSVRRWAAAGVGLALLGMSACASDDRPELAEEAAADINPAAAADPAAASTTVAPPTSTTTTIPLPVHEGSGALITPTGIVAPIVHHQLDGTYLVIGPCNREVVVSTGTEVPAAHVVIDAGHGGEETGAVGEGGLVERDVNLPIALMVEERLEALGYAVLQTRTADYRITLRTRGAIATAVGAQAFVSIHHNALPELFVPTPGGETYYQIDSAESRRLAGLVYEETVAAFSSYAIEWGAARDAGAKYRPNDEGGDYYGILRYSAGVPAVLSEAAYLTNSAEEALLATPEFQAVEADALARAVVRFLTTPDPGSGFVDPLPRSVPAGSGGGSNGCDDPPLE